MFRRYIIGIFEYDLANKALVTWVLLGINYVRLPVFLRRLFFVHCRLGMWLYDTWLRYWFFWFTYYLKRDTGWPQTQDRMFRNPLCPAGVWDYYKRILFEMDPTEIASFLANENLRALYRDRQLRCGFVPQI